MSICRLSLLLYLYWGVGMRLPDEKECECKAIEDISLDDSIGRIDRKKVATTAVIDFEFSFALLYSGLVWPGKMLALAKHSLARHT